MGWNIENPRGRVAGGSQWLDYGFISGRLVSEALSRFQRYVTTI